MADTFTLSGSIADFLGDFDDYDITGLYLESSEQSLTDLNTGVQRVGGGKEIVVDAVAGTWAAVGVPSSADVDWMPAGSQNRMVVHYRHHVTGEERRWESNWFPVTSNVAFKAVVQATPTVVNSTVVTNILAALAAAQAAQAAAEDARDDAVDISGISTSDGVVSALIQGIAGAGPLTRAELGAWVAAQAGTEMADPASALHQATTAAFPEIYSKSKMSYISGAGAFLGIRQALKASAGHTTVQVIGDSTAGLSGNWVRQVGVWAAAYAPDMRVQYRAVDQTAGTMLAPETLQAGSHGTPHVSFSDISYSMAHTPSLGDFTTDLDVSVKIKPTAWPPTDTRAFAARCDFGPNLGWVFSGRTDGELQFQWSPNGTDLNGIRSYNPLTISTTDYTWVRVVAETSGSDVTVQFFVGSDGVTWVPVSSPETVAAGPINQPAGIATSIGCWGLSSTGSSRFVGDIAEAWVRDGVGGHTIAETQPADWITWANAWLTPGRTLDVVNGGWASRNLSNFITDSAKLTPHMGAALTVLCDGHNDGELAGSYYATRLDEWRTGILARAPHTAIAVIAQNPRVSPANFIGEHSARHPVLAGWASRNGAAFLDVYGLFKDDPRYDGTATGALYNADAGGVHPSPDGWQLWADLVTVGVLAGM